MSQVRQTADQPQGEPQGSATAGDPAGLSEKGASVAPAGALPPGESETEESASGAANEPAGPHDESGTVHADAPYGYRLDGSPKLAPGGRPPKSQAAADERDRQRAKLRSVTQNASVRQKLPPVSTPTVLAVVNYQAMGEMVAGVWFNVGTMVVGDEWAPNEKEGEHLAVAGAFRDYFKATNMRDLPPGFALVAVLALYTLKRANKPTIRSKLQLFGAWVKAKMPKRNTFRASAE